MSITKPSILKYGYLELIIGPMFSNKTTTLINLANKFSDKKCLRIKHSIDKRYDSKFICSHNGEKLDDIVNLYKLKDIFSIDGYKDVEYIFIDELQFFNDSYESIIKMVDIDCKNIYAAGLDGTFLREPFNNVINLIPIADKINKHTSKCYLCDKDAPFSKKLIVDKKDGVIDVGGADKYQPACRKHFF